MAYRYRTVGTAALKPEDIDQSRSASIVDFESYAAPRRVPQAAPLAQSWHQRASHALHADPLLGAIHRETVAARPSTRSDRRLYLIGFSIAFLSFLIAVLMGA